MNTYFNTDYCLLLAIIAPTCVNKNLVLLAFIVSVIHI